MMKYFLTLFSLFCISLTIHAQDQDNITISGSIYDKEINETIESASIRILNASDSSYVTGTVTDNNGNFKLTLKKGRYIAQFSFMGFVDQYINVKRGGGNLGKIYLSENSVMLQEAVVIAKAIDIVVKGDTIEYNADSYKVQESAVLEDLIKRIPGAEIDENGKITINGKEISKILVEGKEFFSDDPKVASKNLPASMIEKLQLLDKKSDLAEMTGFDDGEEETVINLTIKPGMKEGMFGSAMGGYGTKDRYEGNGMLNYMRNNTQLTVLGGTNNTNNAGFTDFASSASSNRGGGPPRGVTFGGNNGVAKTHNLGANFATEYVNKLKVNGDFRFGSIDNDVITTSEKEYSSEQRIQREDSRLWGNNRSQNFGGNLRFDWTPDSLTRVIFAPNMQYNKNRNVQDSEVTSVYADTLIDRTEEEGEYLSKMNGLQAGGFLMLSRKLNDKGRTISLRFNGRYTDNDGDASNFSSTTYKFLNVSHLDSIAKIDQRSNQDDKSSFWRASISYVEPVGRNNFLELSYTLRSTNSTTDKEVYANDGFGDYSNLVDTLTRKVENDFLNQNITLSFRSVRQKYNYTIGMGLEPSSSKTEIAEPNKPLKILPRKNYLNFAPRARFNYIWDKRQNLRFDYSGSTNQATTRQLYDGDYTNTETNIERGNPDLKPSFQNRVFMRYQKSNPERGSSIIFMGNFNHTLNDIVSVSTWEGLKRVTSYKNINGNMNGSGRFMFNMPLKNRNFSINSMTFASYTRRNTFISERTEIELLKNRANIIRLQENLGLRFTSKFIDFTARGNVSYNRISNNVSSNNQSVYDYGGYGDFTLHLPYNINIDSDLNYSANSGYNEGFEKKEWLWNASISKDIFKAKNGTIRIKVYDILQDRSNVSWQTGNGYIENITTNTINSYFMASFTYRFQSFKGGAKMGDMQNTGEPMRGGGRSHGGGGSGRF